MDIEHFTPGERVLAYTGEGTFSNPANWKPATIASDAPYPRAKTGGAYISWELPSDTPSWVSRGGWKPQNSIRRVGGA